MNIFKEVIPKLKANIFLLFLFIEYFPFLSILDGIINKKYIIIKINIKT
jgi:hypothetical protein